VEQTSASVVCVCVCVRRKRAVSVGEPGDDSPPSPIMTDRFRVSNSHITSTDNVPAPPDGPLHEQSTFPTASEREWATEQCRRAVQQTDVYDDCSNHTTVDTQHYVYSCVEDIRVLHSLLISHTEIYCTHRATMK